MLSLAADACGAEQRAWLCEWIEDWTDDYTAQNVARHVSPWLTILLITLGAVIVNRIVHRLLKRALRRWEIGGRFAALRRRASLGMLEPASPVTAERRHQRAETIGAGLSSLASILVWVIAIVWVMAVLGVAAATLLTSAGLIGVALAFGAQNLLRDLISGTFMIFEDQIGVGDVIDVGVAPTATVEEVTLRTTRLRDVEGVVWYVPNGEIKRVGNKTQQWSRAVIDVPISTAADLDRARQVIKTTADEVAHDDAWQSRILDTPEVWGVESFTLDSVTIRLVVKTVPNEQWTVARELRTRIKQALDAAGIVLPPTPTESDDPRGSAPG